LKSEGGGDRAKTIRSVHLGEKEGACPSLCVLAGNTRGCGVVYVGVKMVENQLCANWRVCMTVELEKAYVA
jgi:hypothetical protein